MPYSFQSIPTSGTGKADQEVERIHSVFTLWISCQWVSHKSEKSVEKLPKILSCCFWKQWFWMDSPAKETAYLLSCANTSTWEMSWLLKMVLFSRVQSASSWWVWDPGFKISSTDPISVSKVVSEGHVKLSIGPTWTENWKNLCQSVKLATPSSLLNRKSL